MRGRDPIVDEILVLAAHAGRGAAFDELARRWHQRLLRHAGRLTRDPDGAREVAQLAIQLRGEAIRRTGEGTGRCCYPEGESPRDEVEEPA